ncbi:MAG: YhcH/YjgK/YiaL family protein [Verrucomicrobia bacterium]|nr:YhcH/YjgK/YiaL family protein [Verrucomicrobiota bacterium]
MIQDTLEHSARYEVLNSHFSKAFEFLRAVDSTQALGRHVIDGDNVFALVEKYTTKPKAEALFEAHRKYIDVQYVYRGRETILWAPLVTMEESTRAYDAIKDAAKWKLVPDLTELHLSAGHLAILFPEDAHAPGVEWEKAEEVFKVVVKVAVSG